MSDVKTLEQKAACLLESAGFSASITSITPCTRGGNNRTYVLVTPKKQYALKEYFRQPDDKRDRLASEYSFLRYAQQVAAGMVPKAYAKDDESGLALYEFIQGDAIAPEGLIESDVIQAANFFVALNQFQQGSDEYNNDLSLLSNASEACFSIKEHLSLVGKRIERLSQLNITTAIDEKAQLFIKQLMHKWDDVKNDVVTIAQQLDLSLDEQLSSGNRCISPSDFGFHNALRKTNNAICFLDFEYAGWDDPAKMVGDFFAQLAVPVPEKYFKQFANAAMVPFHDSAMLGRRAQLLKNVYQIKWCCIAMNVFIPVHLERRKFANPQLDEQGLKTDQLVKAQSLIKKLEVSSYV